MKIVRSYYIVRGFLQVRACVYIYSYFYTHSYMHIGLVWPFSRIGSGKLKMCSFLNISFCHFSQFVQVFFKFIYFLNLYNFFIFIRHSNISYQVISGGGTDL